MPASSVAAGKSLEANTQPKRRPSGSRSFSLNRKASIKDRPFLSGILSVSNRNLVDLADFVEDAVGVIDGDVGEDAVCRRRPTE
jgi:hypothetical protein